MDEKETSTNEDWNNLSGSEMIMSHAVKNPVKKDWDEIKPNHTLKYDWMISNFSKYINGVSTPTFVLEDCTSVWKLILVIPKTLQDAEIKTMELLLHKGECNPSVVTVEWEVSIRSAGKVLGGWKKPAIFDEETISSVMLSAPLPNSKDLKDGSFNLVNDMLYIEGSMTFHACCTAEDAKKNGECIQTCKFLNGHKASSKI